MTAEIVSSPKTGCNSLVANARSLPSTSEISTSLQGNQSLLGPLKVDKTAADCLAGVLSKSDLSDESLRALVDGDQSYQTTDKGEVDVLQGLVQDISTCTKAP